MIRPLEGPPAPAAAQPHPPEWHIDRGGFDGANAGLPVPERAVWIRPGAPVRVARTGGTLQTTIGELWIRGLDRSDPPGYSSGDVPRGMAFNRNVFAIRADARMPVIRVECNVKGFDPARTPIQWRLQCRHVLCRFEKVDRRGRYRATTQSMDEEWQGRSSAATFQLFAPGSTPVSYDYNSPDRVMGGHAILTVTVRLPNGLRLQDYVHLRIAGTNPTPEQIRAYAETLAGDRNENIQHMIRAVIWQESDGKQFRDRTANGRAAPQTQASLTFHRGTPNQHAVRFDYPDDPPDFPLVAFDFGVGIMQYTKVAGQVISPPILWNWHENLRAGINLFFTKLAEAYRWLRANRPGFTWRDWAYQGWGRYNGSWSVSDPQSDYADNIRDHWPRYELLSNARVPAAAANHPDTRSLPDPVPLQPPPAWPPQAAPPR